MALIDQIKSGMDACMALDDDKCIAIIQHCIEAICTYVEVNYDNCREILQQGIAQLERKNNLVEAILMALSVEKLKSLEGLFDKKPSPDIKYISISWCEDEIKAIFDKVGPLMAGRNDMSKPNLAIAQTLSEEERRKLSSYAHDTIFYRGLSLQWSKTDIENMTFLLIMLYPVCKEDDKMEVFLNLYYNFFDRLNSTGNPQDVRDFSENLLMVGYNEQLEPEAYYGVSRAYALNNPMAGLLYFYIALCFIEKRNARISRRFAYNLLWQILKLMRNSRWISIEKADDILKIFDELGCPEYDKLSVYHTYFSMKFMTGNPSIVGEVTDFVNAHRETIYQNLEHSSLPWMNLFMVLRKHHQDQDFTSIANFEQAMLPIVKENGNQSLLDFYDKNKDVSDDLRIRLAKLETTRNPSDYGRDSRYVQMLAKKSLRIAVESNLPDNFLMAMRCRADYTFVKEDIPVTELYRKVEIVDVTPHSEISGLVTTENLREVLPYPDDALLMLGRGDDNVCYSMVFTHGFYSFDKQPSLQRVDYARIQSEVIRCQYYEKDISTGGGIYHKSVQDFEEEQRVLQGKLKECSLNLPDGVRRFLIVKDMCMGAFPHHLFTDTASGRLIGEELPTVNVISPEVLARIGQSSTLIKGFSCSYWSPYNRELTFQLIRSKLDDELSKCHFRVVDDDIPQSPLDSDINIVCAHGGNDISDTHWFYAGGEPIIEINKIIGKGQLLILFVCHSGSISYKDYDNTMHTLIKRYIRMGYSSIIAPMWSLPTDILQTWLSVFMRQMTAGQYVVDAVYQANMAVKAECHAPSAWACLHLFGNPYLKVEQGN